VPELIHLDTNGFPVVMDIPVPPWLEKDAQQAVEMCPALALRLAADPRKAAGKRDPGPVPIAAPGLRSGLLGGGGRQLGVGGTGGRRAIGAG
jgi:hypothetical protein